MANNISRPPSKRYVEALQERVRNLEQQLQQLRPDFTFEDEPPEFSDDGQSDIDSEAAPGGSAFRQRSPLKELTNRLGRLNIGEDGHARYFGSRSNFSLLRSKFTDSPFISTSELQNRATNTLNQMNMAVDVSEETRDHLLDIFWSWQNSWQYIVIKDLFMRDLLVDQSGRYASPLLLSVILALSARYSDRVELRTDPTDPSTAGNALAEQAKMILLYESQAPNVTTVQAAALLALRETATDKESLGWVYCGMPRLSPDQSSLRVSCNDNRNGDTNGVQPWVTPKLPAMV